MIKKEFKLLVVIFLFSDSLKGFDGDECRKINFDVVGRPGWRRTIDIRSLDTKEDVLRAIGKAYRVADWAGIRIVCEERYFSVDSDRAVIGKQLLERVQAGQWPEVYLP